MIVRLNCQTGGSPSRQLLQNETLSCTDEIIAGPFNLCRHCAEVSDNSKGVKTQPLRIAFVADGF